MIIPSSLIIAGSDSGGGAGIQADLKTFTAHKIYASTVITAITAQNTKGVEKVMNLPLDIIEAQMKSISSDLNVTIIKIGMLSNKEIIDLISFCLKKYFPEIPVILDPVMVAKGGHQLLEENAINTLKKSLLISSFIITPNLPEAEKFLNCKISNVKDMEDAIHKFKKIGIKSILLKGGHLKSDKVTDLLYSKNKIYKFVSSKIITTNTHGTGCTLASALACNIFKGNSLYDSVKNARKYVINGIETAQLIGKGHNPLNHFL